MRAISCAIPILLSAGLLAAEAPEVPAKLQSFLADGLPARHAKAPAETEQFGRLVGLWQVEVEMAGPGGKWNAVAPGIWAWKYSLDGFAVEDLWYQAADALPVYMATLGRDYLLQSNRIYNVAAKQWNVFWMANGAGKVMGQDTGSFTAVLESDDIVMTSTANAFGLQRVTFSEIGADSFRWRSEYSMTDGESWQAVMRMKATRITRPTDPRPADRSGPPLTGG